MIKEKINYTVSKFIKQKLGKKIQKNNDKNGNINKGNSNKEMLKVAFTNLSHTTYSNYHPTILITQLIQ